MKNLAHVIAWMMNCSEGKTNGAKQCIYRNAEGGYEINEPRAGWTLAAVVRNGYLIDIDAKGAAEIAVMGPLALSVAIRNHKEAVDAKNGPGWHARQVEWNRANC